MADPDLASLRAVLLGPERRQLEELRSRIDDEEARAEALAEVLPRVLLQHAEDPRFARALTPPLERALTASVHQNPKPLADALFPVMGPAIRKAVSAALSSMVESLNRALEYSLSARAIGWRLEAMRTGRSFAEVVLAKTLLYRSEQVFLIDVRTGLLIQHVRAGNEAVQDADMVSGMLTAIRDFVRDSFRVADTDSLEALKVGELQVWVEPGPHAILAAVIRGTAPREFRRTLQDTIETIHLQFGAALEAFNGDASTLEGTRPALEACLQSQYRAEERRPRKRGAWIVFAAVVLALATWGFFAYRARQRESAFVARLAAQPGLVVMSSERQGGRLLVAGLRDPLAVDPATLMDGTGLAADRVAYRWSPYVALDPPLILARARAALAPPPGVELAVQDGVLSASGSPPPAWVAEARRVAPFVAGVTRFDAAGAVAGAIRDATASLEASRVLFVKGSVSIEPGQERAIAAVVDGARRLSALADAAGQRLRLEVVGHADADGPDAANLPLSVSRADVIVSTLKAAGLGALDIAPEGVGSRTPVVSGESEDDKRQNRCVTIRVVGQTGR